MKQFPIVNCPCKKGGVDCKDRSELCHDTCDKFLEYKKYNKRVSDAKKFSNATDPSISSYMRRKGKR